MTRLLVIQGTRALLYEGRKSVQEWDTKDPEWPVDADHYAELEPEIFSVEWLGQMRDEGRHFPAMAEALGLV